MLPDWRRCMGVGAALCYEGLSSGSPLPGGPDPSGREPTQMSEWAVAMTVAQQRLFGAVPVVRQVLRTNPYEIVKAGPTGAGGRDYRTGR